jgi:hypothetical protein
MVGPIGGASACHSGYYSVGSLCDTGWQTKCGGTSFKIGIIVNGARRQNVTQTAHDGDMEFRNGLQV